MELIEQQSFTNYSYNEDLIRSQNYRYFFRSVNPNSDAPRALMFHGSYYNGYDFYFDRSFSEFTAVHNYHNIFNAPYYINIFRPDIVIFSSTEYATTEHYFPLSEMNKSLFPDAISELSQFTFEDKSLIATTNLSKSKSLVTLTVSIEGDLKPDSAYLVIDNTVFDMLEVINDDGMDIQSFNVTLPSGMLLSLDSFTTRSDVSLKYVFIDSVSQESSSGRLEVINDG